MWAQNFSPYNAPKDVLNPKFIQIANAGNVSFRGLSVVDDKVAWVSGSQGTVGVNTKSILFKFTKVKGFENSDFRSIYAFDALNAVIANAGSPAYILRTSDGGATWQKVYENTDSAAFIDGIDFKDDMRGLACGDPIKKRMLLLRTNDGGRSWQQLPKKSRPKLSRGEASFAASGTCIHYLPKGRVLIATGGKVSRIWLSDNDGNSWRPIATPILQGQAGTGIFSLLPISDTFWVIAGGDYTRDTLTRHNLFITADGGKTWLAPKETTRGYRECLVPTATPIYSTILAVGPGGIDLGISYGQLWMAASNDKKLHVAKRARNGTRVLLAGGDGKVMVLE